MSFVQNNCMSSVHSQLHENLITVENLISVNVTVKLDLYITKLVFTRVSQK